MKSFILNKRNVQKNWYVVDMKDQSLGRAAVQIAHLLSGKHKVQYTPHVDNGDEVIVINAALVRITGNKREQKTYQTFSGYPSGQKEYTLQQMLDRKPEEIIRHAVKGMLPKNTFTDRRLKRLKIYKGAAHMHKAQNPKIKDLSV